jgi:hypothetical protein
MSYGGKPPSQNTHSDKPTHLLKPLPPTPAGFEYNSNNQSYGGFDPMGGFGAGGYGMDAGANNAGGFMGGGEAETKSNEKKKGDKTTLTHVTCRQLHKCERQDDAFIVDGKELFTVELFGTMHELEEHSTNFLFKLNDGTEALDCKRWIEKENPQQLSLLK